MGDRLDLASGFPPVTPEQWREAARKVLKGDDPGKRLVRHTLDRIAIRPLYTRADSPAADAAGLPGLAPFVRGATAAGAGARGWDVRPREAHPAPATASAQIREDLAGGATSLLLRLDTALAMRGEPPDGICAYDLAALDTALDGVDPGTTRVALDGARFGINAALLIAVWQHRGVPLGTAQGDLGVDPLGVAARGVGVDIDAALARVGEIAAFADRALPRVTALMADGHVYHAGGATEAQELAATLATAVLYLRHMERAGLPPERARRQILLRLAADADVALTIAKQRALRRLWARVCAACGTSAEGMRLHALTATRMLTRRDPWNNLLRTTLAAFAAGAGGADVLTVLPLDHALGLPTALARRLARNIPIVLQEESGLARVIDPLGGAGLIEDLTRQLAGAAWSLFQAIEGGGGLAQMLMKGTVQDWIAASWAERAAAIARRREPITGVSEFPDLAEAPWRAEAVDMAPLIARAAALDHALDSAGLSFEQMIEASRSGRTLRHHGRLASFTPLPPRRLAEGFEALRERSDAVLAATGGRPRIFLCCLGRQAQFGARLDFARNLFAAGGIEAVASGAMAAVEEVGHACKASGAVIAALCAADEDLEDLGPPAVRAMKAAHARRVWVVGRPPAAEALTAAGVDGFARAGDDVLSLLDEAYAVLGEGA
jgi:methylmalonyl-CoA mutase